MNLFGPEVTILIKVDKGPQLTVTVIVLLSLIIDPAIPFIYNYIVRFFVHINGQLPAPYVCIT